MAAPVYKRFKLSLTSNTVTPLSGAATGRVALHAMYAIVSGAGTLTISDGAVDVSNYFQVPIHYTNGTQIMMPFSEVPWAISSGAAVRAIQFTKGTLGAIPDAINGIVIYSESPLSSDSTNSA